MSFYSDASLVMIPSGYKTSKVYSAVPTSGDGDLVFSRSNDTATRVNSAGLIEKVRTNLLTYSNTFTDASWVKTSATITANDAVSPEGVANASKYEGTNATNALTKTTTLANGLYTFSIYVKRIATDNFRMNFSDGATGEIRYVFNLSDETSTTTKSGGSISDFVTGFESLPNGWYRLRISAKTNAGSAVVTYFEADNEVGSFYVFGSQLETSDIATEPILTTTAAVSVGPVANVPRLDYLGSSCPRLLLEPQRTNLLNYSENFDNAYWSKTGATITANTTTSPDGYVNADTLVESSSTAIHAVFQNAGVTIAVGTATFSVFVKPNGRNFFQIRTGSAAGITNAPLYANFDLVNDLVTAQSVGANSAKIESYSNGWKRCSISFTITSGSTVSLVYQPITSGTAVIAESYAGDGTSGIHLWGAMLEQGPYSTSYVNTLNSAVTRGTDAASKTSATALIGQTEGTFFAEVDFTDTNADQMYITLSDGTSNNRIHIGFDNTSSWIYCNIRSGGAAQGLITQSSPSSGIKKIAVGYKLNDYVLYINGVQVGVDTSALVPACSRLDVGGYFSAGFEYPVKQALLFPTRLSNDSLAELTSL